MSINISSNPMVQKKIIQAGTFVPDFPPDSKVSRSHGRITLLCYNAVLFHRWNFTTLQELCLKSLENSKKLTTATSSNNLLKFWLARNSSLRCGNPSSKLWRLEKLQNSMWTNWYSLISCSYYQVDNTVSFSSCVLHTRWLPKLCEMPTPPTNQNETITVRQCLTAAEPCPWPKAPNLVMMTSIT